MRQAGRCSRTHSDSGSRCSRQPKARLVSATERWRRSGRACGDRGWQQRVCNQAWLWAAVWSGGRRGGARGKLSRSPAGSGSFPHTQQPWTRTCSPPAPWERSSTGRGTRGAPRARAAAEERRPARAAAAGLLAARADCMAAFVGSSSGLQKRRPKEARRRLQAAALQSASAHSVRRPNWRVLPSPLRCLMFYRGHVSCSGQSFSHEAGHACSRCRSASSLAAARRSRRQLHTAGSRCSRAGSQLYCWPSSPPNVSSMKRRMAASPISAPSPTACGSPRERQSGERQSEAQATLMHACRRRRCTQASCAQASCAQASCQRCQRKRPPLWKRLTPPRIVLPAPRGGR